MGYVEDKEVTDQQECKGKAHATVKAVQQTTLPNQAAPSSQQIVPTTQARQEVAPTRPPNAQTCQGAPFAVPQASAAGPPTATDYLAAICNPASGALGSYPFRKISFTTTYAQDKSIYSNTLDVELKDEWPRGSHDQEAKTSQPQRRAADGTSNQQPAGARRATQSTSGTLQQTEPRFHRGSSAGSAHSKEAVRCHCCREPFDSHSAYREHKQKYTRHCSRHRMCFTDKGSASQGCPFCDTEWFGYYGYYSRR